MSQRSSHSHSTQKPETSVSTREAVASKGQALITQAEDALLTGEVLTDKDRKSLQPVSTKSDDALLLIADAFDRYRSILGIAFDTQSIRDAIQYEKETRPVAAQARVLSDRLYGQVVARKAAAAEGCLAVYQTMKGVSRLPQGQALRPIVKQIASLLRGARKSKSAASPPASPEPSAPNAAPAAASEVPIAK